MGDFKIYNSSDAVNVSYNKVVRPIIYDNLPGYLVSQINNAFVSYNVAFTTSGLSLDAQIYLEVSADNSNWVILNQTKVIRDLASNIDVQESNLTGFVPSGNYVRLRAQVEPDSLIEYVDGVEYMLS
jgi:3-deoxy-D-arabino-heptulosonate 7-phosphate (DAHP) synthase